MNRKIKWSSDLNIYDKIFYTTDSGEVLTALKRMEVDYILIRKSRIYDDQNLRRFSGYPQSFVDRLSNMPFIKLVLENNEVSIWKVSRN